MVYKGVTRFRLLEEMYDNLWIMSKCTYRIRYVWFIDDQYWWISNYCSCNSDSHSFAARQLDTFLHWYRIVTLVQRMQAYIEKANDMKNLESIASSPQIELHYHVLQGFYSGSYEYLPISYPEPAFSWPAAKNEGSGIIHFLRPGFLRLPAFVCKRSREFLDLWY